MGITQMLKKSKNSMCLSNAWDGELLLPESVRWKYSGEFRMKIGEGALFE
jgi:hypothetical protein